MRQILEAAYGALLPVFLTVSGGYYAKMLWGVLRPRALFASIRRALRDRSARASLSLALAGTLGVGNMAGVAGAVALGGAGAVFWMLLSSFFAMALKYAETKAAMRRQVAEEDGSHGGAMYYLPRRAAIAFALLCLACSFTVGNGIQVAAAASVTAQTLGLPPLAVGLAFSLLLPPVLFRGRSGIFRFAERAVPLMTGGYILLCLAVLYRNAASLPSVMREILQGAFSLRATAGGIPAALPAVRYGFARGLVSNEAGCGTAPIAHAGSRQSPETQAAMGVVEVFADTTLLCTLTALALLSCRPTLCAGDDGMAVLLACFSAAVGRLAPAVLLPSVLLFAFATAVCWSFYGSECLRFLLPRQSGGLPKKLYFALYSLGCSLLLLPPVNLLWAVNDFCMGAMTLLHLLFLFRQRRQLL